MSEYCIKLSNLAERLVQLRNNPFSLDYTTFSQKMHKNAWAIDLVWCVFIIHSTAASATGSDRTPYKRLMSEVSFFFFAGELHFDKYTSFKRSCVRSFSLAIFVVSISKLSVDKLFGFSMTILPLSRGFSFIIGMRSLLLSLAYQCGPQSIFMLSVLPCLPSCTETKQIMCMLGVSCSYQALHALIHTKTCHFSLL